jgi:hypothetical protein
MFLRKLSYKILTKNTPFNHLESVHAENKGVQVENWDENFTHWSRYPRVLQPMGIGMG